MSWSPSFINTIWLDDHWKDRVEIYLNSAGEYEAVWDCIAEFADVYGVEVEPRNVALYITLNKHGCPVKYNVEWFDNTPPEEWLAEGATIEEFNEEVFNFFRHSSFHSPVLPLCAEEYITLWDLEQAARKHWNAHYSTSLESEAK